MAKFKYDDNPVAILIERKKELRGIIDASMARMSAIEADLKWAMQEIERIDALLREFTGSLGEPVREKIQERSENISYARSKPTRLIKPAVGSMQELFEKLVRVALMEFGVPLTVGEIVEALRDRGYTVAERNEWKVATNRLNRARSEGRFINRKGYWPADLPLPPENATPLKPRPVVSASSYYPTGYRTGVAPKLTAEQIKLVEQWILERKPVRQIALDLGGISRQTIYSYLNRGAKAIRAGQPKIET